MRTLIVTDRPYMAEAKARASLDWRLLAGRMRTSWGSKLWFGRRVAIFDLLQAYVLGTGSGLPHRVRTVLEVIAFTDACRDEVGGPLNGSRSTRSSTASA